MSDMNNGGGNKVPILIGAVVALTGASIYSFLQISELKTQLAETRAMIEEEVGKVNASTETSTKSTRQSVSALEAQLAEARRQAAELAGEARVQAAKHADELAAKLEQAQAQQAQQTARVAESVNQVSQQVTAVNEATNSNKDKIGAVSNDVAAVRTQAEQTKAELQKTIADLTSTKGDLGIQSGLIATNAKELAALRDLGERVYTEFRVAKAKTATRVGDLQIRLTKTDPKKNKYTVEVIADDKLVEKKDKNTNEPVQFLIGKTAQPFEMVVNEVKKDLIVGYVSAPKVRANR
jgi:chromosome segregation ATPase